MIVIPCITGLVLFIVAWVLVCALGATWQTHSMAIKAKVRAWWHELCNPKQ